MEGKNGGNGKISREELLVLLDEKPDKGAPELVTCQFGGCHKSFLPTLQNVVKEGRVLFGPDGRRIRAGSFMVLPAWPVGPGQYRVDGEGPLQLLALCRSCQMQLRAFFNGRGEREYGFSFSYEHAMRVLEERRKAPEEEGALNPFPELR